MTASRSTGNLAVVGGTARPQVHIYDQDTPRTPPRHRGFLHFNDIAQLKVTRTMTPALNATTTTTVRDAPVNIHAVDNGMRYPDYHPYAGKETFPETEPFVRSSLPLQQPPSNGVYLSQEFSDPALRADPDLPVFKAPNVKLEDVSKRLVLH
jgi:hypothetical protein